MGRFVIALGVVYYIFAIIGWLLHFDADVKRHAHITNPPPATRSLHTLCRQLTQYTRTPTPYIHLFSYTHVALCVCYASVYDILRLFRLDNGHTGMSLFEQTVSVKCMRDSTLGIEGDVVCPAVSKTHITSLPFFKMVVGTQIVI